MQIILWEVSGIPQSVNDVKSHLGGTESKEKIRTKDGELNR